MSSLLLCHSHSVGQCRWPSQTNNGTEISWNSWGSWVFRSFPQTPVLALEVPVLFSCESVAFLFLGFLDLGMRALAMRDWYFILWTGLTADVTIVPTRKGSNLPPIWKAPKLHYRLWQIKYGNYDMNDAQYASFQFPENSSSQEIPPTFVSLFLISLPFYYCVFRTIISIMSQLCHCNTFRGLLSLQVELSRTNIQTEEVCAKSSETWSQRPRSRKTSSINVQTNEHRLRKVPSPPYLIFLPPSTVPLPHSPSLNPFFATTFPFLPDLTV